MIPCNYFHI